MENKQAISESPHLMDHTNPLPSSIGLIDDVSECSNDDVDAEYEYEYEYDSTFWYYSDNDSDCNTTASFTEETSKKSSVECPICYDQVDARRAVRLPKCGHMFCLRCFQSYIQVQLDAGNANELICPMPRTECGTIICQSVMEEVLDSKTLAKIERCRRTAFVMENKDYHFCPTPNCSNILFWREEHNGPLPIGDCFECQKVSCLKCKVTPYHTNQTCEEWQQNEERRKKQRRLLPPMYQRYHSPGFENHQSDLCFSQSFQPLLYQHPITQPSSSSLIDRSRAGETLNHAFTPASEEWMVNLAIRQCRRCGNGVQKAEGGCYKMKCRCGYRFCFNCGSENAQCNCTPAHHGFTDNITGHGDFTGLRDIKSYT